MVEQFSFFENFALKTAIRMSKFYRNPEAKSNHCELLSNSADLILPEKQAVNNVIRFTGKGQILL